MSDYRIVRSDELYHHGIKGMKWGVRRFQNEDGTLTEKGRKRYEKAIDRASRKFDKSKFGTYEQSVEFHKMDQNLGKIGDDILKNNSNSEAINSLRAKNKKVVDLEAEREAAMDKVRNSKAGQKEIADTIKYYKDNEGYEMGKGDAEYDLISNPKNPYAKTSIINKTFMSETDKIQDATDDYIRSMKDYISKMTGSTDSKYVDRGKMALFKAIAREHEEYVRKNNLR